MIIGCILCCFPPVFPLHSVQLVQMHHEQMTDQIWIWPPDLGTCTQTKVWLSLPAYQVNDIDAITQIQILGQLIYHSSTAHPHFFQDRLSLGSHSMGVTHSQVISPAQQSVQVKEPDILFALQWTLNYGLPIQGLSFKEAFDLSLSTHHLNSFGQKITSSCGQEHVTFYQDLISVW